jgi:hypothetical protein
MSTTERQVRKRELDKSGREADRRRRGLRSVPLVLTQRLYEFYYVTEKARTGVSGQDLILRDLNEKMDRYVENSARKRKRVGSGNGEGDGGAG